MAPRTFADFERLQDGRPRRAPEDLCACGDEDHASWCPAAVEETRKRDARQTAWATTPRLMGEPIGYGHALQTAAARHKARRGR
jgi:hypothetical protein